VAKAVTLYFNAQIRAGAQVIQIFDTWGGALSTPAYKEFSLTYMQQILDGLEREYEGNKVPVILFTKGAGLWLEDIVATGCEAVGLDWTQDIAQVRKNIGDRVALQGNMDPAILKTNPEVIRKEVKSILDDFGHGPGHVFNLGHGITPDINPENAGAFINAVHDLSK
jgi:uroporphyrinogen decarboxylase